MILQEIKGREGEKSVINTYVIDGGGGEQPAFHWTHFLLYKSTQVFCSVWFNIKGFEEDELVNIPNLVQFY